MQISVVTPYWQDRDPAENLALAQLTDRLGYPELWMGEMATYDAFAFATAVGLNTQQIQLAVGPLAVSVRTPMTIAMGAASVADLTGRATSIALGASSVVVVEEWHGRDRERTATHMDETAQIVRSLLDGEKAQLEGELARCQGYRLRLNAPGSALTIAAFSPAAVRTAARRADRMLLNMVTPASLAALRDQLQAAANAAGRETPRVAVWLPTAVDPSRESIDQLKRGIVGYLAAPGYGEMMAAAGFEELVAFARTRPHPRELLAAMPDALIAAVGLLGSESEVAAQLEDYKAAGADEVCIVPATAGDDLGKRTLSALK
ncbi:LLM class F420-dependent oxidoreductase [Halioglobus japonicus]|uniref:LLM class F420-dependent oxidoreductase n=1 Tax=Halioglobus japonicus TaxID=930805 RepID=A0AAP8SN11_9GAMM|nr:LLM class F420-dependent oxidoreductase [Halioglobus japonicus]AQA17649.1 LLM class F420-dependent oxidoreductase [Halioglobus japonicus]PLW85593.1 LLM class F420-dependent oxidoreductase [Halioglobus japonicus]GHD16442.1 LLM class F420-dependent oxidoreductase [Halioglobus japonicus]